MRADPSMPTAITAQNGAVIEHYEDRYHGMPKGKESQKEEAKEREGREGEGDQVDPEGQVK